jgi:hypothetical protein
MKKKSMVARIVNNPNGVSSIEINCPIMMTWGKDGRIIGAFSNIPKGTTRYQRGLVNHAMDIINSSIDLYNEMEEFVEREKDTPIPDYIKRAFHDDDQLV